MTATTTHTKPVFSYTLSWSIREAEAERNRTKGLATIDVIHGATAPSKRKTSEYGTCVTAQIPRPKSFHLFVRLFKQRKRKKCRKKRSSNDCAVFLKEIKENQNINPAWDLFLPDNSSIVRFLQRRIPSLPAWQVEINRCCGSGFPLWLTPSHGFDHWARGWRQKAK